MKLRGEFAVIMMASLAVAASAPERRVTKNVITSEREPKVSITLPKDARYCGASRWDLYGIADAELHAYVEANKKKDVRRLYWVQFEGYLPSQPNRHYQYNSPEHTTIGGWDFYVDAWPRARDEKITPGSDREHIEELVRAKGYTMPANMIYVRLVHLLSAERRRELMIIYSEDLAASENGLTAADLEEGGKAYARWPEIAKGLLQRAKQKIKLQPGD